MSESSETRPGDLDLPEKALCCSLCDDTTELLFDDFDLKFFIEEEPIMPCFLSIFIIWNCEELFL